MKEIGKEGYAYISYKTCGCLALAVVDNPEHKRDVAKEVAKAIRLGETVERVIVEDVRAMEWYCAKHKLEKVLDKAVGG